MKRANRNMLIGAAAVGVVGAVWWYKEHVGAGDQVVVPIASLAPAAPGLQLPPGATRVAMTVTSVAGDNVTGSVSGVINDQNNQVQPLPAALGPITISKAAITGKVHGGTAA